MISQMYFVKPLFIYEIRHHLVVEFRELYIIDIDGLTIKLKHGLHIRTRNGVWRAQNIFMLFRVMISLFSFIQYKFEKCNSKNVK